MEVVVHFYFITTLIHVLTKLTSLEPPNNKDAQLWQISHVQDNGFDRFLPLSRENIKPNDMVQWDSHVIIVVSPTH